MNTASLDITSAEIAMILAENLISSYQKNTKEKEIVKSLLVKKKLLHILNFFQRFVGDP